MIESLNLQSFNVLFCVKLDFEEHYGICMVSVMYGDCLNCEHTLNLIFRLDPPKCNEYLSKCLYVGI